jgi:hypothetical protein
VFVVVSCRSCDARIIWARTTGDRAMPVDADPVDGGNIELSWQGHRVVATVTTAPTLFGPALRTSHFMTCPDADKWRATRTDGPGQRRRQQAKQQRRNDRAD